MLKRSKLIAFIMMAFASITMNLQAQNGASTTGIYQNLFKDVLGKTDAEISTKVNAAFQQIFYGGTNEKVYYPVGTDMAYILDVANNDVRSEGMSYGMMICAQLDKQAEFDKLWKWAKTNMQHGANNNLNGYFAWQCNTNGSKIDNNPAPDGEAYFITSLFFASHRWGNGTGIFNYGAEAQDILVKMMNKTGAGSVYNLFNATSKLITFGPYGDSYGFTDPSYQLPAFWELWAEWSKTNTAFWTQTPEAARTLIKNASNSTSGLTTDYSNFDGTPKEVTYNTDADRFMYDAWRTAMNVGMDYNWHKKDTWQPTGMTKLLTFFKGQGANYLNHYDWNGANPGGNHSTGLIACNAAACLAVADQTLTKPFIQEFWNVGIPTGTYRYYDGMLYMLSMLHCSGNFKIYKPSNGFNVRLTAPAEGSKFTDPATIALSATATSTTGTIAKVEFFNGTVSIGSSTVAPYAFSWENVPAGVYTITVVATDNTGATTTSGQATVTVTGPSFEGEITIRALGVVGDETIELEVDGAIIETWTLATTMTDYTATANVNGVIRVNYTNDDGADRDAQIDYIIVAGKTYEAEDQAINTGYYANGSCGGGSNSELMHCSGYIEFATTPVSGIDLCPNDPDKTAPGECGCGIPEGSCTAADVELKTGWNMIGYPFPASNDLATALASVWQYTTTVKDQNGFYTKDQATYLNSLTEMMYAKGYFIYVTQDCSLTW